MLKAISCHAPALRQRTYPEHKIFWPFCCWIKLISLKSVFYLWWAVHVSILHNKTKCPTASTVSYHQQWSLARQNAQRLHSDQSPWAWNIPWAEISTEQIAWVLIKKLKAPNPVFSFHICIIYWVKSSHAYCQGVDLQVHSIVIWKATGYLTADGKTIFRRVIRSPQCIISFLLLWWFKKALCVPSSPHPAHLA